MTQEPFSTTQTTLTRVGLYQHNRAGPDEKRAQYFALSASQHMLERASTLLHQGSMQVLPHCFIQVPATLQTDMVVKASTANLRHVQLQHQLHSRRQCPVRSACPADGAVLLASTVKDSEAHK